MSSNKENIIAAAEKLETQGVNPTQVTVREALGGGSFATIGPILKAWKELKKEDHALTEIQVPESITERLEQLQGAVWQAAVDEAERRLSAEREALKAIQEQTAAEVSEQLESVATLEAEAEEFKNQIEALDATAETQSVQIHNLSTGLVQVKEQAKTDSHAAAEAIVKEASRADAAVERAERAEALHDKAQSQARADLADLRDEHKAEIAALKKEIEAAKQAAVEQVRQAEAKAQEQTRSAEKAEKEAQQRAAGEQACQSRLEAAKHDVEQAQSRMEKLEEKAEKATKEAAELRGELKAVKSRGK